MTKILMSACLLGQKVRYDGGDCLQHHARLQAWIKAGRVIVFFRRPSSESISPEHRAPKQLKIYYL